MTNSALQYKPAVYILAAGNGSRLWPFTRVAPKPLLRVSPGKRVSYWAFKAADKSGLPIFAGIQQKHKSAFATAYSHLPVTWLETPPNLESGGSFLYNATRLRALGYTHAIVIPADYYVHVDTRQLLERVTSANADACLLTSSRYPYFDYLQFANTQIVHIGKHKHSPISYIGVYAVKLDALPSKHEQRITTTEVLNILLKHGRTITLLDHTTYWVDLGTKSSL